MYLERNFHLPPMEGILRAINSQYGGGYLTGRTHVKGITYTPSGDVELTLFETPTRGDTDLRPDMGEKTFTVQRFSLNDQFPDPIEVRLGGLEYPITTNELVEVLSITTGVYFTSRDVVGRRWATPPANDEFVINAHPESIRWLGSITVKSVVSKHVLADMVDDTWFPDLLALSDLPIGIGMLQLMDVDFTDERDTLRALERDRTNVPNRELLRVINRYAEWPWVIEDDLVSWNLAQLDSDGSLTYRVLYNGRTESEWTPRTDVNSVAVLELSSEYSANVGGYLTLHYN